jgi:Cytochrome c554 and c-prime
MQMARKSLLLLAIAALAVGNALDEFGTSHAWAQSLDGEEILKWQPNSVNGQPADYTGWQVCAECHGAIHAAQMTTGMANAAMRPAESAILRQHPTLSVDHGPYTYSISSEGRQVLFSVSDSQSKITEPVVLAVGTGNVHQSYLIRHNSAYYQVPVGYYSGMGKLLYLGSPSMAAGASLEAALGDRLTADRIRSCMGCHGTANGLDASLDSDRLAPGIACETCHGPGAKHAAAMKAGKLQAPQIFDPARLKPEEEMEFCGECHHFQDVKKGSLRGIRAVLSQPYRLTESRCWNPNDKRSHCTFCHDPHGPLVQETAAYDAKCLSCHVAQAGAPSSAAQPGKACPVGKQNCVVCHMPQVEVPGSHASFTDHRIRIVHAGAPYPE